MASDPLDLSWKEYQNLLTCPDEEFGKWFEAAQSWKEPWEVVDFAALAAIIVGFLFVAGVLCMIGLDIFGIPWRQWLQPSI